MELQQDNHDKIKISLTEAELEKELKILTPWKKNHIERFNKLGSKEYDELIQKMSDRGY